MTEQDARHNHTQRLTHLLAQLPDDITRTVREALQEDLDGTTNPNLDITASLIPVTQTSTARLITREAGIFCGKAWADEVFMQLNISEPSWEAVTIDWQVKDGDRVSANQTLCLLHGSSRLLLTGERTAMNFIQTLSGCATVTADYVAQLQDSDTQLLDTRKTLPNLRSALKYAVHCGGGHNHRIGVVDAYLIKENHIIACGSIAKAITQAQWLNPNKPVEVEVETLAELQQAIEVNADIVMLDNFTLENMRAAVTLTQSYPNPRPSLEVSGNVTLSTLADIAHTKVDYISVGALTKHIRALDLSMRFI